MYVRYIAGNALKLYAASSVWGVCHTTDRGASWTPPVAVTVQPYSVCSIEVSDSGLYVGTYYAGVYRSTDSGEHWNPVGNLWGYGYIDVLAFSDTHVFVFANAYPRSYLFRCALGGMTWSHADAGLPLENRWGSALAIVDTNVFAAVSENGVFRSTDKGTSWSPVNKGLTTYSVTALGVTGSILLAGTGQSGIFRSTDNGNWWTEVNQGLPAGTHVTCFAFTGREVYAGTWSSGVFRSTDNGLTWKDVNPGLTSYYITDLAACGTDLFALVGHETRLWRRSLAEMADITTPLGLPNEISLEQNFPNPFNPTSTIRYGLPERSRVILAVYNNLGQKVAQLVDGDVEAGYHEVKFEGSKLASGVYLYRLQAGSDSETRRLCLVR